VEDLVEISDHLHHLDRRDPAQEGEFGEAPDGRPRRRRAVVFT
jgi:hypothetical protein